MNTGFGTLLRHWRMARRLSQLDLALGSNVSSRHISFLETGRARPSRAMVIQLSESMQVPRGERNALLTAAGFAEVYRARDLNAPDLAHIRAAIAWMLERHDPFPGLALDKHWCVVGANVAATRLLAAAELRVGDSLLEAMLHSSAFRGLFENLPEVMRYTTARLRTENAQLGGDLVLENAIASLAKNITDAEPLAASEMLAVVPIRYRAQGETLALFSTVAQFGTAEDIALADLRIELMFPADDATRALLSGSATLPGI